MEPWVEEHRFHAIRKWRTDFAWPGVLVAVEVEGGAFSGGRHTRGAGFVKDCEKYNTAALMGWIVLRFVPHKDWTAPAVQMIKQALELRDGRI